jgi:hypothetical protein
LLSWSSPPPSAGDPCLWWGTHEGSGPLERQRKSCDEYIYDAQEKVPNLHLITLLLQEMHTCSVSVV